jgi:hypothetical protein
MAKPKAPKKPATRPAKKPLVVATWEDDPMSGGPLVKRAAAPHPAAGLKVALQGTRPAPKVYARASDGFRYWSAADALGRALTFWNDRVGKGVKWRGPADDGKLAALPVFLDAGVDLNAYYDRHALNFFHDTVAGRTVYTAESPDVVTHELGHAVLDAIRPELWSTMATECAAFHESFGDMSALLVALQQPDYCASVLQATGGRLSRTSRLSRVAEELGWAIRQRYPSSVDPDSLRNAANAYFYRDPDLLPASSPASSLSREPHNFSRVFTGAFLETIAGMVLARDGKPATQTPIAAQHAGDLLVAAVRAAPVVTDYFSEVAGAMVRAAAARFDGLYVQAVRTAFVRFGVLSLEAAQAVETERPGGPRGVRPLAALQTPAAGTRDLEMPGDVFGLGPRRLLVTQASGAPEQIVRSATTMLTSARPSTSETEAEAYMRYLIARGRVKLGPAADRAHVVSPLSYKTHELRAEGAQAMRVHRTCFDCGFDAG